MSHPWKALAPVAALALLVVLTAVAVMGAGAEEPPSRRPVELSPAAPSSTAPTDTPTAPATRPPTSAATDRPSGGLPVVPPRPRVDDDDDDDGPDDGDDADDDADDDD